MEKRAADMTAPGGLAELFFSCFHEKAKDRLNSSGYRRAAGTSSGSDCKTSGERVTMRWSSGSRYRRGFIFIFLDTQC